MPQDTNPFNEFISDIPDTGNPPVAAVNNNQQIPSQDTNPFNEFISKTPEPSLETPRVKADIQLTPESRKPVDSSFTGRAGLSLDRDKAEADLLSQQMQAGDVGIGNQVLTGFTHPVIMAAAKFGSPKLTQQEAVNALQQGTAAKKLEDINQQFIQMPNAKLLLNPVEWASQAISNNVLSAAGLAAGIAAIPIFGLSIPAAIGASAGGAVMGAIGKAVGPNAIEKPENPNDPNDPFYSRKNQATLANLNAWQDAGGLVGGLLGGGIGPKVLTPNKTLSKGVTTKAGELLDDVYTSNSNQASALLKTAKGLNIDAADLPRDPDKFVPAQILDLQKRVNQVTGHAENTKSNNILNEAIFSDKAPKTTTRHYQLATDPIKLDTQKQANSAATDLAFKNTLATQRNAFRPFYKMIDKHGFLPEETEKVNKITQDVVKQLTDENLVGALYGNNALSLNYVTKGLAFHAGEIADASPKIIDSILNSLKTTIERDPLGNNTATLVAQQAYSQLFPVVQAAKINSIKAHLMNPEIMGSSSYSTNKGSLVIKSNALTELEVEKLAANINGAYSGKGQVQNQFNSLGGAVPANQYGSEMSAGYVSNRAYYRKAFAPKGNDIKGYDYNDYLTNITKNMFGDVIDFGNKLINSNQHIKSVMDTPEYIKAFGGEAFSKEGLSYQEQKNALDSSLVNVSNALGVTFGDGINSGIFPDAMTNGTRAGLQRILQYGEMNQKSIGGWIVQNPDAAPILFKFNKAGIERHKTYQEILEDISTPDKFPVFTKKKVIEYIKNQEDPEDYKNLVEGATNNFTNHVTDLILNGKPEQGAKIIDLANQYRAIFGQDADPILTNAYEKLGLGVVKGDKELVSNIRNMLGNNTETSKNFTNQIAKVQKQVINETLNEQNKTFLMRAAANPFNPFYISKIAIDALSRMIPFISPSERGINKAIGDSLQSRANYEAAKAKIDKEQARVKLQHLMNVFTGGQAGK